MSTLLFAVAAAFHLFIPLGTAAVLAWRPARSKISRALGLLALLGYTGFLFAAGAGWGMLGQGPRFGLLIGVAALCAVAAYRCRRTPTRPRGAWAWVAAASAAVALALTLLPYPSLANARMTSSRHVDLHTPLEQGTYLVIHGGGNAAVNHHALVTAQQYALDVVALDGWGRRAAGVMPAELEDYAIFGKGVLAPCPGTILAVRSDLADLPPLESTPSTPAGNHILLHCPQPNVTIVLAHLQKNGVAVAPGQHVAVGDRLGRVGNTGNTSEPHLHIHAVDGRVGHIDDAIRTAAPVAMRFDLRMLVRNDVFEGRNAER